MTKKIQNNDNVNANVSNKPEPKKTGRGGVENFGNNRKALVKSEEDRKLVQKFLNEVCVAFKQEKVKSNKELAERLTNYFETCANTGQVPTVEEMAMHTGYSSSTLWDWENDRNQGFQDSNVTTSDLIKKSKDFIKTFDAKMVIAGKMNFLAYCFRAKNYYGMHDKKEFVMSTNAPLSESVNDEELAQRYQLSVAKPDIIVEKTENKE